MAAVALDKQITKEAAERSENRSENKVSKGIPLFHRIVHLRVREALLLSPSAALGIPAKGSSSSKIERLGAGYFVVKIRGRITEDGGKSVAIDSHSSNVKQTRL